MKEKNNPYGKLRFIGRQGFCRYYWRIFQNGSCIMYAKVDSGILGPVAGGHIYGNYEKVINDK